MFLKKSRYYSQTVKSVKTDKGKEVKAIGVRRLPLTTGDDLEVKGNHRLDILSQEQYEDPTRFWHIADANTELEANQLVKKEGRIINFPED